MGFDANPVVDLSDSIGQQRSHPNSIVMHCPVSVGTLAVTELSFVVTFRRPGAPKHWQQVGSHLTASRAGTYPQNIHHLHERKEMSVPNNRRRRKFVDTNVQGAVLKQAVYYWLWGSATFALILFVYRIVPSTIAGNGSLLHHAWYYLAPIAFASGILLPLVILRAIHFSHTVVGPMLRIRRCLIQLADGEPAPAIELRENDHWSDIAEAVNAISQKIAASSPNASPEQHEPVGV